jgi:hypothetical protein
MGPCHSPGLTLIQASPLAPKPRAKSVKPSSWLRETRRLLLEYRKTLAIASQRGLAGRLKHLVLG